MSELCLIITIVRNGWGDRVIEASCKAGAEGATVMWGRGVGIHEHKKFMGIPIEPEKEIVLSVINRDKADLILEEIVKALELDKPGHGLAFVLPIERLVGMVHAIHDGTDEERCR